MTDELNRQLAKFASETGRTVLEWLEAWQAGAIDQMAAASERHDLAVSLRDQWQASQD